ncbi:MAG: 50S ribosomal protein L10 [Acidobacteriota bacterium]|jgi:large subunit ribosomal protein L10
MALSRSKKEQLVVDYEQGVAEAPHAFVFSYQGISVPKVTELRQKIRESGGSYVVVKNRLVLRAIEGTALEGLKEQFRGPTAVVYGDEEPVALAKILTDFQKDAPVIQFRGGLLNGRQVDAEQIKEIANLPSREELIAKLLFLLKSPVTRLVRGLGAIPQQFVSVLEQIRLEKEKQG